MKLTTKRMWVFFSVALNVGFAVMALVQAYQHSIPHRDRSFQDFVGIVERLDLPADKSQRVLEKIRQFRVTVDGVDADLKRARGAILSLLAQTGPLDQAALHQLMVAADDEGKRKSNTFETHVLELRQLLGDEKGAQFFFLLQQHFQSKDRKPHP